MLMCSSDVVITFEPAVTITELPMSNIEAVTSAEGPMNAWITGKQKLPMLNPEQLSIRNARSATGLRRVAAYTSSSGSRPKTMANTEISSMLR